MTPDFIDTEWLQAFERLVQSQQPATKPWEPVTDYSFEARKAIEGQHPQLIKDVFQPVKVLDVGCGPYHLVHLLRALDISVSGIDREDLDIGQNLNSIRWEYSGLDAWCADLVICREVLEHLTIRQVRHAVANLCAFSTKYVYLTTRFAKAPRHLLDVDTSDDLDPTHITMLNQHFLRLLFVLEGFTRRPDLEARMDWQQKGRVLVYERG